MPAPLCDDSKNQRCDCHCWNEKRFDKKCFPYYAYKITLGCLSIYHLYYVIIRHNITSLPSNLIIITLQRMHGPSWLIRIFQSYNQIQVFFNFSSRQKWQGSAYVEQLVQLIAFFQLPFSNSKLRFSHLVFYLPFSQCFFTIKLFTI